MRYLILALISLLLFAACASLSEDECRAGNWREIGREDGMRGRTADFIQTHAKACADYGIRPDRQAWEDGRQDGLLAYCTPHNAYREGTKGHRLSPVCPAENLPRLLAANDRGLDLYDIEREIDDVEREMRDIRAALATLPPDDPARASLRSQLSFLNLKLLRLQSRRLRLRSY